MADTQKFQEEAVRVYRKCALIPSITNGSVLVKNNTLTISSTWSQRNLENNENSSFARSFHYPLNSNEDIDDKRCFEDKFPRQLGSEQLSCESVSGNFKAVLRKIPANNNNKEESQHLEIWSQGCCVKCYTTEGVLSKHGKINSDETFGCLSWSPCEKYLLYVAEEKAPKTASYFEVKKDENSEDKVSKGNKFVHKEDWGELLVASHVTVLVVLDTEKDEARIMDGVPNDISPGQAIWGSGGHGIIFCGWSHEPYRLGLKFCDNRKSGIYHLKVDAESCEMLSDGTEAVSFPRLSPDGSKLIYLSRMLYGPHRCCQKIVMYDWQTQTTRILVDEVNKPENGSAFPGFFASAVAKRVWSEDGTRIVLDTAWRCSKDIIVIDCNTGKICRVTSGNGCWSLLDLYKDFLLASFATPSSPPQLMLAKLPVKVSGELAWVKVADCGISLEKEIAWKVIVFTPEKMEKGTWRDYEGFLMKPKTEQKCPLIVFPHGGPHSVSPLDFMLYPAAFCQLGFSVLMVNYRGSLGFGQTSLLSLPGNIGTQDVRDVQHAAEVVLQSEGLDRERVFMTGGSHGGFLSAHLIGQYPKFYKACAMRNPVINLAAMVSTSDIPDWCYCEVGENFSFTKLPSKEIQVKLLEKSPIVHAYKVEAPTLVLLGGKDLRVPPSQGKEFFKTLQSRGVKTRLLFYPEGSHPLWRVETEADVFINIVMWFTSH